MRAIALSAALVLALFGPTAEAGELMTTMTRYLDGAGIAHTPVEGRPDMVRSAIPGPSGAAYLVVLYERAEQEQMLVYAVHEKKVPEHRRAAVAEFLARANYGMPIGNFELDMDDGELRFKSSVDVEGGALTPKMAENLIVTTLRTIDRYAPGAMKVAYDNGRPAAVIAEIEG